VAVLAALVFAWGAPTAHAAGAIEINFEWGKRRHREIPFVTTPTLIVNAAPVVERRWVAGYYERRLETVLVEPEHSERQWVPPVVEMREDRRGQPYSVLVKAGYYVGVRVPARYETREVAVWVPGYWQEVPVAVASAPCPTVVSGYASDYVVQPAVYQPVVQPGYRPVWRHDRDSRSRRNSINVHWRWGK